MSEDGLLQHSVNLAMKLKKIREISDGKTVDCSNCKDDWFEVWKICEVVEA